MMAKFAIFDFAFFLACTLFEHVTFASAFNATTGTFDELRSLF
jgi:hypothetical protein